MADSGQVDALAAAIRSVFISANESDSNLEPANVVDGLYMIARSIEKLAIAVEEATLDPVFYDDDDDCDEDEDMEDSED
jgi:hypothetical protein